MIRIEGVTVEKGGRVILDDVTACLADHRVGIVGSNGSGKSTFAKLLNGLETTSRGRVLIDGTPVSDRSSVGKVGFVFQSPDNQIVFPLVGEDLAFGLKKSGLAKDEIRDRVVRYLERFGLFDFTERRTHELSGGEKQLIALIGVLVMEPSVIVLDEPTTLLDLRNRGILLNVLEQLHQKLIMVSHDLELMMSMDHLIWIDQGRIALDGKPADVLRAYRASSQVPAC